MGSRVRFNDFDNINLNEISNETGQTQFFKNIKVLCKFNSKIHLVSYLHLQFINNFMLFIVIIGSFLSGLLDTINHNNKPDKDLKLVFGCIELFIAMLIAFYKQSKIAENQQDHYHSSNNYKILLNKINTDLLLMNTNKSIYISNIECIRDITDKFNDLIINAPIIPYYILKKYHIKETDLGNNKITNNIINNIECNQVPIQTPTQTPTQTSTQIPTQTSINNTLNIQILDTISENSFDNMQDVPLDNLKNKNNLSPKKNRRTSLNKSYSIKDLNSMKQDDIDNYQSFINKINIKDEEKYTNNIIHNFRNAF